MVPCCLSLSLSTPQINAKEKEKKCSVGVECQQSAPPKEERAGTSAVGLTHRLSVGDIAPKGEKSLLERCVYVCAQAHMWTILTMSVVCGLQIC